MMTNHSSANQKIENTLLTASAVADKLGISIRTLRRLELQGKVPPPLRIGGSVRWPVKLIDAWIEAGAPDVREWKRS
jgi:predicted DNA-binding transcriptional regulator AlpA